MWLSIAARDEENCFMLAQTAALELPRPQTAGLEKVSL
jgi:hypothetical protein